MSLKVRIQKLVPEAKVPGYAHPGDAGMDLYSAEDAVLQPAEWKAVRTGISLEIPPGWEGQVRPKSGLALEHGLGMVNAPGTIDSGYRGEIKVILMNFGKKAYSVEKGKKIAQLVFARVETAELSEAKELEGSRRGHGGFGSTGLD